MKIALLEHPFRKKTQSTNFLIDLLKTRHEVDLHFPGGAWRYEIDEVVNGDYDLVICFQHEFYALPLVANNIPTIIMPMYDGSGQIHSSYWKIFKEAGIRSVNFSKNLHQQQIKQGMESCYVQYFPNPEKFEQVKDFSTLRGFFWQRRPDHQLHWHFAKSLLIGQLSKLHVHNAPDVQPPKGVPQISDWPLLNEIITESTWFEKKEDFLTVLNSSNIFIAPRLAEGIGLAALEAMAQGQCVIAHNDATMDEYIKSGYNGFLYEHKKPRPINLKDAEKIGLRARQTVEKGYQTWSKSKDKLLKFIEETPHPTLKGIKTKRLNFYKEFPRHYFSGMKKLLRENKHV